MKICRIAGTISIMVAIFFLFVLPSSVLGKDTVFSGVAPSSPFGMNRKLTQWVARTIDMNLEIVNTPFKRRLLMMKTGDLDFMVGLFKRPGRETYIYYLSIPYRKKSNRIFWVLKGKKSAIKTYEDLYFLKIGTTFGAKYFDRFDRDKKIVKEPVSKMELNLQKLVLNRIDAVIASESSGIQKMIKLGIQDKVEMADYFYSQDNPVYVGISKKSPLMDKIAEIENKLVRSIQSREVEKIIIKYYRTQNLPVPRIN